MKLNNETQSVGLFENICDSTAEQSIDADINLPDYCPEIQRILKCNVIPNISSVHNNSGRITADVNAVVRLIYVGDNGKTISFEQSYPIHKIMESDSITTDSAVNVKVNSDYVNCRAVNSRRVDIKAMLTFVFKVYNKRTENILCHASGAGIQTLKNKFNIASLTGLCDKQFSMSEVIEVGENKKPVFQILNIFSVADLNEVKIISNKVLVKGDLRIKIHYLTEDNDTVECIEHSMPVSQIIEADGVNESDLCSIRLEVCSCEAIAKSDSSGEIRLIELNAVLNAFLSSFSETDINLISDAYSTDTMLRQMLKIWNYLNTMIKLRLYSQTRLRLKV